MAAAPGAPPPPVREALHLAAPGPHAGLGVALCSIKGPGEKRVMPCLCSPLSSTPKLLQALSLLPAHPGPVACLLKGAKVFLVAVAPPRSHPATVLCWDIAQRAGSDPRGAEPSREPLRRLPPPASWVSPWGCFNLRMSWGKWHLTTPKLETGHYLAPPKRQGMGKGAY